MSFLLIFRSIDSLPYGLTVPSCLVLEVLTLNCCKLIDPRIVKSLSITLSHLLSSHLYLLKNVPLCHPLPSYVLYCTVGNNGGPILHAKSFSYFVSDLELFIRKKVRPSISAARNAVLRESAVAANAAALALALGKLIYQICICE